MVPYYKRNVYYKNISNTFIFKKKKIGFKNKIKKNYNKKKFFIIYLIDILSELSNGSLGSLPRWRSQRIAKC